MVRLCIWGLINAINQSALKLSQQRALLLYMEKHDGHHVGITASVLAQINTRYLNHYTFFNIFAFFKSRENRAIKYDLENDYNNTF